MSNNEPPPGAQPTPGVSTAGPATGSQATTPPPAADDTLLRESLEDASVLLWYATREGKPVDDKLVEEVVETKAFLSAGQRHHDVETRFWSAYRALAVAVLPVSVDSILATYGQPFGGVKARRYRTRDAMTTKRIYSYGALFVLFVLLITQIYSFVGATFRTDLEDGRNELDRISGTLRAMTLDPSVLQVLDPMEGEQTNEEQLRAGISPVAIEAGDVGQAFQEPDIATTPLANNASLPTDVANSTEQDVRLVFYNNTRRGDRLAVEICGYIKFLDAWDLVVGKITSTESQPVQQRWSICDDDAATDKTDDEIENKLRYMESVLYKSMINLSLLNTKSTLTIVDQYLLPLLYGLLGALAYVLRTLSTEIQNVTFTRGSDIRYSLRWPLGMLGGVTVGLFFDPASLSGLAAITPLGLAFLAGYGVELVFTGLDRLVHAFTGEGSSKAQPT